jgi:hypothetical protein
MPDLPFSKAEVATRPYYGKCSIGHFTYVLRGPPAEFHGTNKFEIEVCAAHEKIGPAIRRS